MDRAKVTTSAKEPNPRKGIETRLGLRPPILEHVKGVCERAESSKGD